MSACHRKNIRSFPAASIVNIGDRKDATLERCDPESCGKQKDADWKDAAVRKIRPWKDETQKVAASRKMRQTERWGSMSPESM